MMPSLLTPGRLRAVNLLCLAGIILYAGWYTFSFQIRHHAFGPSDLLDYALNYERSLLVADQLNYPPWSSGFLYPPPNLVLRLALGRLGLEASAVLWMAITPRCELLSSSAVAYEPNISTDLPSRVAENGASADWT